MKTTFIYILIDPRDNNICYIGKSNNPFFRYKSGHKHERGKYYKVNWLQSLLKLGIEPSLEILDEVPANTREEWGFWERYYIAEFKKLGFNLVNAPKHKGGEGGDLRSGTKNSKQHNKKISLANKGKKMSSQAKLNMRLAKRKPVIQSTLDDVLIKEWNNISEAATELNLYTNSISNCCQGKQEKAYGYKWEFKK